MTDDAKIRVERSPSSRRAWIEIFSKASISLHARVALLAEGVDRNYKGLRKYEKAPWSPSSRRAWIEICSTFSMVFSSSVALLAEGVDRNTAAYKDKLDGIGRPPRGGRG